MHLVSTKRQAIPIEGAGFAAQFEAGESIHTESAYKFDADSVAQLGRASGFDAAVWWSDSARRFADFLLIAR